MQRHCEFERGQARVDQDTFDLGPEMPQLRCPKDFRCAGCIEGRAQWSEYRADGVDDKRVFGEIFGRRAELLGIRLVLIRIRVACNRARQRVAGDDAASPFDQNLGRRTDQRTPAVLSSGGGQVDAETVVRVIECNQFLGQSGGEDRGLGLDGQGACEDNFVEFACSKSFDGSADPVGVDLRLGSNPATREVGNDGMLE